MSVLISHPSVAPFVQQAAQAIHEAGMLEAYHTTFCYQPDKAWQKFVFRASRSLGRDLEPRFRRRTVSGIPAGLVRSHPLKELLRLAAGPVDASGKLGDSVWEWAERGFDSAVERSVGPGLSAVYGYEHCSEFTFRAARDLGVPTLYDVPAPEPQSVEDLLDEEVGKFPILDTPFYRHTRSRIARRIARRHAEWQNATIVIAASGFTKRSFQNAGFDTSKVRIIPYGSPPPLSSEVALTRRGAEGKIRLIWAGTFSIRKGAHYLIDAWRRSSLGRIASLDIYGTNGLPSSLYSPWPDGVVYHGPIARTELTQKYTQADALIFPTLCDGFGMVASEAWACGCPVITTACAGASDFLKEGVNGLMIEAGKPEAIANVVDWCARNRGSLASMREESLMTAASWQWSDYRERLSAVIREIAKPQSRK